MSGARATPDIIAPALWLVGLISEWLTALGDTMIVVTPLALLFLALEGYYGRGFRFQWLWSIVAAPFLRLLGARLSVDAARNERRPLTASQAMKMNTRIGGSRYAQPGADEHDHARRPAGGTKPGKSRR